MKINAIITGATGMVGEGLLHECLLHPDVEKVLVVNRKPCGVTHPKLQEIIHSDFFDLTAIEKQFSGYNTCFFCLGVSSLGLKEAEYHRLTYDLTMNFAQTLLRVNSSVTFCYISGAGTDSTEKGSMWARVKGKTENHLLQLPFKNAYMFRPGFMQPTRGLKNTLKFYHYVSWMFPALRILFSNHVSTLREVALGMINAVRLGSDKKVLEVKDIVALSKRT
jgi:uncharacterized protein YbjT (DUF2867 family)